jgi:hypothetical protein
MKKAAIFVFAIAHCCASLRAQQPKTVEDGVGFRFEEPAQEQPAALTKIYSNLGPPASAYCCGYYSVTGPLSPNSTVFIGMPFTPKANYEVKQVRAAIQYSSGANQVELSLYSDAGGVPGAPLAETTVTNLPAQGTCCTLAIANFPAVAVTAGIQYWVVASTPATGTGADFDGGWAFVPPAKSSLGLSFYGGGWESSPSAIVQAAGEVFGTAAGAGTGGATGYAEGLRVEEPAQEEPTALTKIYSNLGPPANPFGAGFGEGVFGPLSAPGFSVFVGMPFTPKANYEVKQVRAAIQFESGANQVELSLYSDAGGVPGTPLAQVTVTNLPAYFTCCTLAIADFPAVAVTAGTQYWIVASTPTTGTGADFQGVWAYVLPAKISDALSNGSGWFLSPAFIEELAGAVYGTAADGESGGGAIP